MLILANRALLDHHAPPDAAATAAAGSVVATGGLVEAVRPVLVPWEGDVHGDGGGGTTWIGAGRGHHDRAWTDADGCELIETPAGPIRHRRLYLGDDDWRGHYAEVANGFFWPLLHLVREPLPSRSAAYPSPTSPDEAHWRAWERVNRRFAAAALEEAAHPSVDTGGSGEVCWVHDYQLALVPALLRAGGYGGRVGFFLHTPFPSLAVAEPFLPPPVRAHVGEWLSGVLGADLVGLQTEADAVRLREAAARLCGAREEGPDLHVDGRLVRIAAFPVGIETESLATIAEATATTLPAGVASGDGALPLVVGLERADYTKGVPERLAAVSAALESGARFAYAGFSAPTREGVAAYDALQAECDRLAAQAERLAEARGLPFLQSRAALAWSAVVALLREASVVFTASLADGMNLVPLQAAIAQASRPEASRGVILAGRDAGVCTTYACHEADGLVPFDPLDAEGAAAALREALAGKPGRISDRLVAAVREHDARAWGSAFLGALEGA